MRNLKTTMSNENQKKPEIPSKMSRLAWPKAKYGLYLAAAIIIFILIILYKDLIL
jgi:hypothetical protein